MRIADRIVDSVGLLITEYLFGATGQKGVLSRSKAYTAQGTVEIYSVSYDARGRLTQQNWIVPGAGGGTFRLDHSFNAAD